MIDVEIKRPHLKVRLALANITEIKTDGKGYMSIVNTAKANWEYASVGLFGKMIDDLSEDEAAQMDQYSDEELQEFGGRVKVTLGNPTKG